jgi:bacterioferritin
MILMNKTVNELNAYLKGEYMAIDSYEKFIGSVKDRSIKSQFQRIQKEHKDHAARVAERIQSLGGRPVNGLGLDGKIIKTLSSMKYIGRNDDDFYVNQAYSGEDKGIKMAEEVVKGDLDRDSTALIKDLLNQDREHLSTLQSLLKH